MMAKERLENRSLLNMGKMWNFWLKIPMGAKIVYLAEVISPSTFQQRLQTMVGRATRHVAMKGAAQQIATYSKIHGLPDLSRHLR